MAKMTINVRKRILKLHTSRRRQKVADYVKDSVARFAKADRSKIRLSPELNKFLVLRVSKAPKAFEVEVEKKADRVDVILPKAGAPPVSEIKKQTAPEKTAKTPSEVKAPESAAKK